MISANLFGLILSYYVWQWNITSVKLFFFQQKRWFHGLQEDTTGDCYSTPGTFPRIQTSRKVIFGPPDSRMFHPLFKIQTEMFVIQLVQCYTPEITGLKSYKFSKLPLVDALSHVLFRVAFHGYRHAQIGGQTSYHLYFWLLFPSAGSGCGGQTALQWGLQKAWRGLQKNEKTWWGHGMWG